MGDQRIFEFENGFVEPDDLRLDIAGPEGFRRRQIKLRSLGLDEHRKLRAIFGSLRPVLAPAVQRGLEIDEAAIEARAGDRRRQIADERRRRPALGDGAFRGVVGGVEIKVRQVRDEPIRPAGARQARLLSRHELQRSMGAEMQHCVGAEIFAHPAIEGREGVGRREALFEEQAHGVALVAEGGLHAHEDIAEALAQDLDAGAIGLLPAGRRAPLGLDLLQPALAAHMLFGGHAHMHIGERAETLGVAFDDGAAQGVHGGGRLHRIARALHGVQHAEERFEHREIGGGAGVARIGREVEEHHADLATGALGPAQQRQFLDAGGEGFGALGADMHVAGVLGLREHALALATAAGGSSIGAAAEHGGARGAVELGNRHHDGGFHGQQAPVRILPLLHGLELDGMGGDIGNVEPGEDFLRRLGVVIGGAAHQGETHQRHHGVDGGLAVLHEEFFDGRAGVKASREGGDDAQAPRFQRRDHAVVVTSVARQHIGAHEQQAHSRLGAALGRRQLARVLGDDAIHARMIDADLGIFDGRLDFHLAAQMAARTIGVAIHQIENQIDHVLFRARQPILHGEEIGAHILRRAGDEAQDLRQAPQHLHLIGAGAGGLFLGAAQLLQQAHGGVGGRAHVELADARQLRHFSGGERTQHGVAGGAARFEDRQQRREVVFHEKHGVDDDVALPDVIEAALQSHRIRRKFRRRMHPQREPRNLLRQHHPRAIDRARHMGVHGDENDAHGRRFSGRSELWRHTKSRW